jgi:hypothetical protein
MRTMAYATRIRGPVPRRTGGVTGSMPLLAGVHLEAASTRVPG